MERPILPWPAEDHICGVCPFEFAAQSPEDAVGLVRGLPERYAEELAATPAALLPRRPDETTWSALEYLCHVRDAYAAFTIRLYRVRTEDAPALEPMLNDLRAARFGYRELPAGAVLQELARNVAGFGEEVARVRDWERVGTRVAGESRTARWLVRQAAHEGLHHLADIGRVRHRLGG